MFEAKAQLAELKDLLRQQRQRATGLANTGNRLDSAGSDASGRQAITFQPDVGMSILKNLQRYETHICKYNNTFVIESMLTLSVYVSLLYAPPCGHN